ncbi:uncharacterized protein LOC117648350 [Thrips palmi]|uniref:Uncharacterized protein LOC117648350 n=1 Tax=Thrips palmi TaxID=161013 RepID=A0A6P8ZCT3_THRPL|nr:uncharacterized protein LOC117648350 [Thrips palmi]
MAGSRCHEFDLRKLQCPATWGSGHQALVGAEDCLEKLCIAATPWAGVVERLKVAWSFWENSRRAEATGLLVECYMRLLPQQELHQNCDLIKDYRRALRLVLDSTWASMRAAVVSDKTDADYLRRFIAAVEPASQLDNKQLSAVYALRGRLTTIREESKWFRKAIALNPEEGEWRHLLGWVIQEGRKCRGTPSSEEMKLLRDAYRLRKHPDTVLRLARSLTDCGPKSFPEARTLVAEALQLYPDHPRVLSNVANILIRLEGLTSAGLRQIRSLYQRTQDVVGERAFIQMKLATVCLSTGEKAQAQKHFDTAMRLNPSACAQFAVTYGHLMS